MFQASIFWRNSRANAVLMILFGMIPLATGQTVEQDQVNAAAQNLTLFEDVERTESNRGSGTSPARPNRGSRATIASPEFTLLGTSRIGTRQSAIIRHKDGERLIVRSDDQSNTPIAGHTDYALVSIEAGQVSIHYPGNNPCEAFPEQGVSCSSAANIAQLQLVTGVPIASNNPAVSPASGDDSADDQGDPVNPFEALRAAQQGGATNAQGRAGGTTENGRFTPRRIAPEDVPEGKRVVATPFGDRLVDQ
jgi:hypothetical protein